MNIMDKDEFSFSENALSASVKKERDVSHVQNQLKHQIRELRLKIAQHQLNAQINQGYIRKKILDVGREVTEINKNINECSTSIKRIQTLIKSAINEQQKDAKLTNVKSYEAMYI